MTDWDDPIDDRSAELNARFRDLEEQEELERMRSGKPPTNRSRSADAGDSGGSADDLADIKASLDGDSDSDEQILYVLLLCPHCDAKNRTNLTKLRQHLPKCGGCGGGLSFAR